MVERSPVTASFSRTFGSTRGWQDRASEATAPGAFHHSVTSSRASLALAGVTLRDLALALGRATVQMRERASSPNPGG